MQITSSRYREMIAKASGKTPSKYKAKRTTVGGKAFASGKEAKRYAVLLILSQKGEIEELELQPRFPLLVNGHKVGTYVADFRYRSLSTGRIHIEDVKGVRTPTYKLKKKLFEALYPGQVIEEG